MDLELFPGEVVALVGESGSGKSTLAHSLVGLLPRNAQIAQGRVELSGRDIVDWDDRRFRSLRGKEIGLIPQDPSVSLNPVMRVGTQVAEALLAHRQTGRIQAQAEAVALLDKAGLDRPEWRARQYPHELSGGMRQRVLIAIAVACSPRLLIADEPTSALDVTVQRRILDHLDTLTRDTGTTVLLVTHDLGIAADRADRVVVMHAGRVVESGPVEQILRDARHPYTRRLLASAAGLHAAAPARTLPREQGGDQATVEPDDLVRVADLVKEFPLPRGAGGSVSARHFRAVDGVSFTLPRGRTLALVGESGSGKSTTARLVLGLTRPTSGTVRIGGQDTTHLTGPAWRGLRRQAQLVYQNPYASLDPRFSVEEVITEPLRAFRVGNRASQRRTAARLLDRVALPEDTLGRRPVELSGGQRQRVAIARALALSPDLVVCDEAVSALDVSVQAQVLELLAELQQQEGLSYLFITHDLGVVRQIAHHVAVMRSGQVVEQGDTHTLFTAPRHAYTHELLSAIAGTRRAGATS